MRRKSKADHAAETEANHNKKPYESHSTISGRNRAYPKNYNNSRQPSRVNGWLAALCCIRTRQDCNLTRMMLPLDSYSGVSAIFRPSFDCLARRALSGAAIGSFAFVEYFVLISRLKGSAKLIAINLDNGFEMGSLGMKFLQMSSFMAWMGRNENCSISRGLQDRFCEKRVHLFWTRYPGNLRDIPSSLCGRRAPMVPPVAHYPSAIQTLYRCKQLLR